jgi:hypothetical protein
MARSIATALVVTALFLERIVEGLYQGLQRELPGPVPLLGTLFLTVSLYAWFWWYSRARRIAWPMDLGWLLIMAWPILLPCYIVGAEGRRGWGRIGLFCGTYVAAALTGWATAIWVRLLAGSN